MTRLIACPSCRRHVFAVERDCPFCGHAGLVAPAPGRLSTVLLGLCLIGGVGCDAKDGGEAEPDDKAEKAEKEAEPPADPPVEPPADPPVEPPADPPVDSAAGETGGGTTSAEAGDEAGSEGTDAGASVEDAKPVVREKPQRQKYGAPRPTKKYGAPPMDF